jgi:signal peptidase II
MLRVLALGAGVVAIDQLTKYIVLGHLAPGTHVDVVPGFLTLTLVMNPGLAFGLLGGVPTGFRWLVALLSLIALGVLARVALRVLPGGSTLDQIAVGLIFGGAVGNLIDRVRFGAVVDFVDVHLHGYHWPAFNAADSAITVGVILLAIRLLARPAAAVPERN